MSAINWPATFQAQTGATNPWSTPARALAIDHALSPSQVSTWQDCPARWYYGHVLNLPDPPNGGLALGRALHATIAAYLSRKANESPMVPWEHGEAFFRRQFQEELHEARLAADEQPLALAAKGVEMLAVWLRKIEPELYPATWEGKPAVEVQLTGLIGGVQVHAIADAITTDGIVHDFKTAAKKSGALKADHALQLTTYAMLAGRQIGRLWSITKAATVAVEQHTLMVDNAQRLYANSLYQIAGEGMQSGLYPPRRSSFLCSKKHCAFVRQCVSEWGGEVD